MQYNNVTYYINVASKFATYVWLIPNDFSSNLAFTGKFALLE